MVLKILIFILFTIQAIVISGESNYRRQLEEDLADDQLDDFTLIEAAFIVSGVDSKVEMVTAFDWYDELIQDIEAKNLVIPMNQKASAERLFLYFHTTWLKTYQLEATTLLDVLLRKEFNCVSATVLFNLTCDELGLNTHAFETPSHVYTVFSNFDEYIMVENTSSMGFNIMKNLKNYSRYLARYYPEKMIYKIGLERLYAYENSRGREINNRELVGLICYNQAFLAAKKKEYALAYDYVLLAQKFNKDSRSNQKFEIRLYYNWGKELFDRHKFYQAFEVTADAVYRYDDNSDFKKNCLSAFHNALNLAWMNKDWPFTERSILEMADLEILTDEVRGIQKNRLLNWLQYFVRKKEPENARRVIELVKQIDEFDSEFKKIERQIKQ